LMPLDVPSRRFRQQQFGYRRHLITTGIHLQGHTREVE
jgi:hypothetical protein